jgi:hypothetical protein
MSTLLSKLAEEFAPGIPSKAAKSTIPTLAGKMWAFSEQRHDAKRAGLHSDLRLSDGQTALSWAIRKGLPLPGQTFLAIRQPDHTHKYISYAGPLGKGYGEGMVSVNRIGMTKIISSSPETIRFAALDKKNPSEFLMFRTPKLNPDSWLIKNVTPTVASRPDMAIGKPKFNEAPVADLGRFLSDRYLLSSKIDGAHLNVKLGDRVEVFSHQPSVTGEHVNHTYVFGFDGAEVPEDLKGTTVKAEGFAMEGDKVIPNRELSGILNSAPEKALKTIKERGLRFILAPLKVIEYQGKSMGMAPYNDHLPIMKKIVKEAPGSWMMPDIAVTPEQKEKLVASIKSGKHPLTTEGMVAWPVREAAATPFKLKFRDPYQVYISEIYPMVSKGKVTNVAGGFSYSLKPGGPAVGRVGTGFSDELRKELWVGREELKGRKVIIEAPEQFPGGAYRAPSFVSFHL